jgi:hypothetical protein
VRETSTGFIHDATGARYARPVRRPSGLPAAILALPAARLGGVIAAGVLAVSLLAGAIRVLPLLLAPGVSLRLAPVLARGVLGVSLETALFVAPPIAWALATARLVERGEARALFASGVGPARIVASTWPAALAVALASALAAASWGREASAPGRLVRDLLGEARAACSAAAAPAAVDVPLVGLAWVCLPGEAPRLVGAAPFVASHGGAEPAVFSATALEISDDLRGLEARGLTLALPSGGSDPGAGPRIHVGEATIHGVTPIGRASNLGVVGRALLLGASAVTMAAFAAASTLRGAIQSRVRALALGVAGPAAALLTFSSLERAPTAPLLYAAAPLAGILAIAALAGVLARSRR